MYSQWRGKCEFGTFYPASAFVSADTDAARKPPLAIHSAVTCHFKITHKMSETTIIEILIDNSGSMGYMKGAGEEHENKYLIDGVTRMTLIKKILIEEVISTIDYANQIIIRTFRTESKKVDDSVIEELSTPIIFQGNFDRQKILSVVTELQDPPPGGTPITGAIEIAVSDLSKYPNSDRKIILLTDGEENGGGNYLEAAKKAKDMEGIPCKIFIIGLAQDEQSETKSRSIANGGYYNVKSKSFTSVEVQNVLAPIKTAILKDTIQNIQSVVNRQSFNPIHEKTSTKISYENETDVDATTLTIDTEYSETVRQKSELFIYNLLCQKYGIDKVKWLNKFGESYSNHDFELIDEWGVVNTIIECKGTANDKPTFYLTKDEWHYFLENKDRYQIYRVFNVYGEMKAVCIKNLLNSILGGRVVPYLTTPSILKENRVFLTLNIER